MFNSGHKFKTSREDRKGNALRFICAFLAFALVFGSISAVVILKNNEMSLRDIFAEKSTTASSESESTDVPVPEAQKLSGNYNFLVYCADAELTEIIFAAVINADMDAQQFKVIPLNPDKSDYLNALKNVGSRALIQQVEKDANVKIDKYAASNSENFALAINYMDGLKYTVTNRIEYRNDEFTLILTPGKQTVKGETLLKYFRYCKTLGDEGLTTQGKLLCAMLDSYINEENVSKGETIYRKLLSKIDSDSDISYVEAVQAMQVLKAFCLSDKKQSAITVYKMSDSN